MDGLNPLFLRMPSPGLDGVWGTTDDDYGDLRLVAGSPAIDSGDASAVPADSFDINSNGNTTESLPTDLLGFPRFVDDPAAPNTGIGNPPVDRGCYESQVNCLACPGPREWRSPLGGAWEFPGNWSPSVPQPTHDTLFNLASTYTITLPTVQSIATNSATFTKGSVTVDLKADTWSLTSTIAPSLTLGDTALNSAVLSLTNSSLTTGALSAVNARIGSVAGATGTLNISGAHTSFSTTRSICVGCDGNGLMTVSNGAAALSRDATIGDQPGSYGYVQVTGPGSRWDIPFFLIIDHGELNVSNSGVVNAGFGVYLFDEGTISGNGTLNGNVVNFGAIAPGNSPGTLTINGSYQQVGQVVGLGNVSGQLRAQAAGASAGQFDKLVINGPATLGGGLSVSLLNNYTPATTDQLQLVTATGGLTKPFDVVFFPALTNASGTTPSDKYFRAAYSGLRGPGSGSVSINLGTLPVSPTFNSPQQFILDNPPSTIAVGDLNGDNLPDVAITIPDPLNPTSSTGVVVVLFNQGGVGQNWQGFAPHLPGDPTTIPPIPVGINPKSAAITALSSSGTKHLLVANASSNTLSILKLVASAISTVATQPTDTEPVGIAATDFSGLGNATTIVVVACSGGAAASTGSMTMLANTSAGGTISFIRRNIPGPQGHKPVNPRPFNPDQDKDIDLAVVMKSTDGSPDVLAVYTNGLNPGAASPVPDLFNALAASAMVPVGAGPVQALSGKLARISATNPGGKFEDVITINADGGSISVLINATAAQDSPAFAPAVEYHFDVTGTTASSPLSGTAVDLDGSGTLDVAVVASNPSGNNRVVKLLRNDSTENLGVTQVAFAQMPDLNSGSKPLALVAGDVDGDGQPDLITINSTLGRDAPNTMQIVRNALPSPSQTIGACCYGSSCRTLQATQCGAPGQRFSGFGTACNGPGNGSVPCCKGDFDQNGTLALSDIFSFLNAWFAGAPQSDTDDNGTLAIADIFVFLNAWFAGC
jgi:T5SS/PEP-CTERM-associated repeat protein